MADLWGGRFLGTAHWVGAMKRGAEVSYMQLQEHLCLWTVASM